MIKPEDCYPPVIKRSDGMHLYAGRLLSAYLDNSVLKSYSHICGYEMSHIMGMADIASDSIEFAAYCGLEAIYILRKGI